MGRYLDAGVLKDYCRSTIVKDIGSYEAACVAAEDYLDGELGRRVELATAAHSIKVFRPNTRCSEILWIYDCVAITSVTENGSTVIPAAGFTGNGYVLQPLNNQDDAGRTVPYDSLARVNSYWAWNGPVATVAVDATWGWQAIPAILLEAAKVAGKAYIEYKDIRFGLAALAESGGVGERQAKAVRDAIDAYQSVRTAVIA